MKKQILVQRGKFGEITSMPLDVKKKVEKLLKEVENAEKVDEHGNWEFGLLAKDYNKGMVHSINCDFYAVGYDIHNRKLLAIVQVREFYRRKKSYYPQVRKNYYLIGRNEDRRCFSHPVEPRTIHDAIKKDKDVIKAVQDWIFQGDYSQMVRQGDICLKPVRTPKGEYSELQEMLFEDSHKLFAEKILLDKGVCYCLNPRLDHLKGTHPSISGQGWHKIIIAKRTDFWRFAAPTLD